MSPTTTDWPPESPGVEDQREAKRFYGVTTGRVINLIDPLFLGRVQVQLPFIDFLDLSPWARIATPMSGILCGMSFLPQIADEVLVAFEHGDVNVPYVIGSLWSAFAPPVPNFPVPDSPVRTSYSVRSLLGNQIVFNETPPMVTIQNGPTPPLSPAPPAPGAYQTVMLTPAGIVVSATTVNVALCRPDDFRRRQQRCDDQPKRRQYRECGRTQFDRRRGH